MTMAANIYGLLTVRVITGYNYSACVYHVYFNAVLG